MKHSGLRRSAVGVEHGAGGSPAADVRRGDERFAALLGRHGWQFGVLGAALTLVIFGSFIALGVAEFWRGGGPPPPADFVVFWGAARLAAAGDWIGAFDAATLAAAHGAEVDDWFPWAYPPAFLLLLMPLGTVDFGTAWLIFSIVSLVAMAGAVRAFDGRVLPVWLAFAFAPACLPAMMLGQTTLLWMAGLLAALAALRSGRQLLAGVLIGLLTLKPQLGLLVPVALVVSGQWRAIWAAAATTIVISAVPTLYFGLDYWRALADVGHAHYEFMKERAWEFHLMPSIYAELRALGIAHPASIAAQWLATGIAGLVVARAWLDRQIGFDLKAAVLAAAIPLSTPYLWYYDSAFVALAGLFLLRAGVLRFSLAGFPLLALFWLGAGLSGVLELLTPETIVPIRELVLPVILIAFAIAASAVLRCAPRESRLAA